MLTMNLLRHKQQIVEWQLKKSNNFFSLPVMSNVGNRLMHSAHGKSSLLSI